MADIFISYSSADREIVRHLSELLEAKGWTVWWDTSIQVGRPYATVIETELDQSKCVIVLWTENSIKSEWVKNEANEAMMRGKLLPVLLQNIRMPIAFRHLEAALLFNWDGEEEDHPELELLYTSIQSTIGKGVNPKPQLRKFPVNQTIIAAAAVIVIALTVLYYSQWIKTENLSGFEIRRFVVSLLIGLFTGAIAIGVLSLYKYTTGKSLKKWSAYISSGVGVVALLLSIFILPKPKVFHLYGKVVTAAEFPIRDAQVSIDGTKFFTRSVTNGAFDLKLEDYSIGNEITLIVTHNDFEDKEIPIKLSEYTMQNLQFTLNPLAR